MNKGRGRLVIFATILRQGWNVFSYLKTREELRRKHCCSSLFYHHMVLKIKLGYRLSFMNSELSNTVVSQTRNIADLVKKFLPNFCQWSFMISSTLCFLEAKIDNHASTAHRPSFSRMWSEPAWAATTEDVNDWVNAWGREGAFSIWSGCFVLTSAKALLSTEWEFTSIHQITKELPARRSLIQLHFQSFGHTVTSWKTN